MGNNEFEGKIDAKGKLELYRSFWTRLKEVVSAPEVSRRLTEAVGKKKRLDWYSIRDYDLSEKREDEFITDFPRDGDIVLVIECENQTEGETFIKFDSPNADSFDLAKYRKLRHNFSNLYLTNKATEDKKILYLLLGRGDWEIERHHPEEEIMAINADTVDLIHASASREANKLLALGADKMFPDGAVRNIQSELDANKSKDEEGNPRLPVVGDMFIAKDTGKVYICFTAGVWTDITGIKSLFDAHTILAAVTDNNPVALTVAEQRLVGRITGGNIAALTPAQIRTLLNIAAPELGWSLLDNAYVDTGLGYFLVGPNLANKTISKVKIYAKVAPTGASLIVDVNKNGTTIFTVQAKRPEIAISGNSDDSDTPDIASLSEGDRLSFDIDQIGSTVAGGNPLLVTVVFT